MLLRRWGWSPHQPQRKRLPCGAATARSGLTVVELVISMTIMSLLSVVLGGLALAVQSAWQHAGGVDEAAQQARAGFRRVAWMVGQTGVYRDAAGQMTHGLAVVERSWSLYTLPEILVVWSGGREGGMASAGIQDRLPLVSELIIFAPDPAETSRLIEYAFPDADGEIDFRAPDFEQKVLQLLDSPDAEPVLLCDRIRTTKPYALWIDGPRNPANVRFVLTATPDDDALSATIPGTSEWFALAWAEGLVSGKSGVRQLTVDMEWQICTRRVTDAVDASTAPSIPFFGSAVFRYSWEAP